GFGLAADAASSDVSSHVSSARRSSWDGCGMLDGGIVPVCTLRTTFSQTSASAPGLSTSIRSSLRSAVLRRSLWHVTQYRSTRRRGLDAGATAPAAERAGWADVCTWRQTHRITGKSLVMWLRREIAPPICALQYARTSVAGATARTTARAFRARRR